MTTAYARPRLVTCSRECAAATRFPDHHDRLLAVDTDMDVLLELIDIAVTWHELDYSESGLVGPDGWLDFAENHDWRFPDRAYRALALASDVARRHTAGSSMLAEVIELVRH
jgi:hypothetical protein